MLISFFRIIKFSLQDIFRNFWLSLVTITILILALFSINIILIVKVIGQEAINVVKERIDVNLYLNAETDEKLIFELKDKISQFTQVKEVIYISKKEALKQFQNKHQDNPEILKALKELGKNPLTPSLIIKPKNAEVGTELTNELNKLQDEIIISKNFTNHKIMLEKINTITQKINNIAVIISIIFILTTLLVIFNSIRISIYTHKREINIMRLVGASHSFVYMPFILSGVLYTFFGMILLTMFFFPFLNFLNPYLESFFVSDGLNLAKHFKDNFLNIFGVEFLAVSTINILASFLAVRKYAKI